jgi:hypothetical protein
MCAKMCVDTDVPCFVRVEPKLESVDKFPLHFTQILTVKLAYWSTYDTDVGENAPEQQSTNLFTPVRNDPWVGAVGEGRFNEAVNS